MLDPSHADPVQTACSRSSTRSSPISTPAGVVTSAVRRPREQTLRDDQRLDLANALLAANAEHVAASATSTARRTAG
jgi:hypothetical protein